MPNRPTTVTTNTTPDSIKGVQLRAVTFKELWAAYPSGNPYKNPAYTNQCAIRLSVALHRVGIEMKSFSSKLVKPLGGQSSIGRILLNGRATATRANELGEWLRLQPFAGLGKAENVTGNNWRDRVEGRTGIIMFDGYWTREGEADANASGGHIDLWNGEKLTGFGTGIRIRWNIVIPGFWSDFRVSKRILFFPIK
ncbi:MULTISPECIES: type VI secretion system amidase effector protein Tae4 [Burkholderia]|uniref:type VI secretion system amidase effector protein Tae4 n=1 Tax=Burkholderia TaxID=32008 RepID=UPI0009BEBB8B|nr:MULTISPECIES: type VI secretion system amidase effector protein Tae4 [Burkholderia]MCA7972357.1 type VI secretion system amidase effector protein Tae4 [Burkholderia sp. AU39826]MCA8035021.1 type VI secretion system amidase effector protein Tae4 [Burkholderia arboris]